MEIWLEQSVLKGPMESMEDEEILAERCVGFGPSRNGHGPIRYSLSAQGKCATSWAL